jgi:penicillin-binding protein 1C
VLPGVTGRQAEDNHTRRNIILGGLVLGLLVMIGTIATFVASSVATVNATLIAYEDLNASLPDASQIFTDTFQSSRIYDRDGNLLQEVSDPNLGWRTFVPLEQISPNLVNATIAAEDATCWEHYGVEPVDVVRGAIILVTGQGSSGGSTVTQQLVRSLFPEQIGYDYSVTRKIREAMAAIELERRYSKADILTMYLNQIFYGQRSYGIEAASQTFFDKHASDLTLAEASLLAGLPQLPSTYDPTVNFELSKQRQQYVLNQMVKLGYVTRQEADAAYAETLTIRGDRTGRVLDNPHFTQYVNEWVIEQFGADALYHGGLEIQTTIDSDLQNEAEAIVRNEVASVAEYNVSNGAAVIMAPQTGEILAMVGSANFDDPLIDGQVNITTSPQQPGSSMKPVVYATAFEQAHWSPGTTVLDMPFRRDTAAGPYEPVNFTGNFYGAITVRTALSNSLNIPALKAAENVGPPAIIEMGERMGMTHSFDQDPSFYGLSIALGGAEVQMVDLVNAYGTLANSGKYVPITPVRKVTDGQGNVLFEVNRDTALQEAKQVLAPEYAYQLTDILSDDQSRRMLFGEGNIYEQTQRELGRQTAVKTGTTNDIRDQWTMGYTTAAVAGVWVGNTDNSPMQPVPSGAGPGAIWNKLMRLVHENEQYADLLLGPGNQPMPETFPRPSGVYEGSLCANTGHLPSSGQPTRTDLMSAGNAPILRCGQLSAWEQRDLAEAMSKLGDPRLVAGAAQSVRNYAAEAAGQNVRQSGTIQSPSGTEPGNSDSEDSTTRQRTPADSTGNTTGIQPTPPPIRPMN